MGHRPHCLRRRCRSLSRALMALRWSAPCWGGDGQPVPGCLPRSHHGPRGGEPGRGSASRLDTGLLPAGLGGPTEPTRHARVAESYDEATTHLRSDGWPAALFLPTRAGHGRWLGAGHQPAQGSHQLVWLAMPLNRVTARPRVNRCLRGAAAASCLVTHLDGPATGVGSPGQQWMQADVCVLRHQGIAAGM